MSKISQELKVLLYLNDKYHRTSWVKIKEISDYLEVSDRQARRYLEDLNNDLSFDIFTRKGPDGGYHLRYPLDQSMMMKENFSLALSIAMKRNEKIEKVLQELPSYVITESVSGDNYINNEIYDRLELLLRAIQNQKEVLIQYQDFEHKLHLQAYKIIFTNNSYYLYGVYKDNIRKYRVDLIKEITILGSFKVDKKILKQIETKLSRYGIIDDNESTLKVRCANVETLELFDKYFEGKGTKDYEELTYTVIGSSEHELYYPLFRIGVAKHPYEFLDKEFKERYITYIENQIKALKG